MGNHKFRLSDMMPSAWFYKLRHISRTRNHSNSHPVKKNLPSPNTTRSQKPHLCQPITQPTRIEKFYHSPTNPIAPDTHLPRKSATKRKTIYKPSPRLVTSSVSSCHCSCHATLNSVWTRPDPTQAQDCFFSSIEISADHEPEFESNNIDASESFNGGLSSWSSSGCCRITSSTTDIIIDMNDQKSYSRKLDGFDTILELNLPPILTKPVKFKDTTNSEACKVVKEYSTYKTRKEDKFKTSPVTRNSAAKLRANFPRKTSKKLLVQACGRSRRRSSVSSSKSSSKSQMRSFDAVRELTDSKSLFQFLFPPSSFLSEGFALTVKKASLDPQREFKESMVEMIVENNIRASKDLEELLACYLSLNSYEFHDFIVKAFVQIWFDMAPLTI